MTKGQISFVQKGKTIPYLNTVLKKYLNIKILTPLPTGDGAVIENIKLLEIIKNTGFPVISIKFHILRRKH